MRTQNSSFWKSMKDGNGILKDDLIEAKRQIDSTLFRI